MKIRQVLFSPGISASYFDDQAAIKKSAKLDGFIYTGKAITPGYKKIRHPGESISVILILENGSIAYGDCTAVQYSGAAGRDPLFLSEKYLDILNNRIKPVLENMEIVSFRQTSEFIDSFEIDNKKIHTALRYGITQAMLDAKARIENKLMTEVIADEYTLPLYIEKIPIFAQSGDDIYTGVDKMILKKVDVLPHCLINNVEKKLGRNGEKLIHFIEWMVNRVKQIRDSETYVPVFHIDVYGTIGDAFDYNIDKIIHYILALEKASGEFQLYIEGPVDMGEKNSQIEFLGSIKEKLKDCSSTVKIVADEWCNTYEDIRDFTDTECCDMVQIKTPDLGGINNTIKSILYCKEHGMESYQGGSANETDISSRICVHTAMAARPDRILAKPGLGFDEGYSIVKNEMSRIIQILTYKNRKEHANE